MLVLSIMRHYPYEYTLWYNLAQAMKCDIYLKLWSYAQNCLICTLHPFLLWKEIEYQIWSSQACKGFMLPLPCSWCYEWYHIVFLYWICIECMSSEPLWKMYLHGNKHFLNLKKFDVITYPYWGLKLIHVSEKGSLLIRDGISPRQFPSRLFPGVWLTVTCWNMDNMIAIVWEVFSSAFSGQTL